MHPSGQVDNHDCVAMEIDPAEDEVAKHHNGTVESNTKVPFESGPARTNEQGETAPGHGDLGVADTKSAAVDASSPRSSRAMDAPETGAEASNGVVRNEDSVGPACSAAAPVSSQAIESTPHTLGRQSGGSSISQTLSEGRNIRDRISPRSPSPPGRSHYLKPLSEKQIHPDDLWRAMQKTMRLPQSHPATLLGFIIIKLQYTHENHPSSFTNGAELSQFGPYYSKVELRMSEARPKLKAFVRDSLVRYINLSSRPNGISLKKSVYNKLLRCSSRQAQLEVAADLTPPWHIIKGLITRGNRSPSPPRHPSASFEKESIPKAIPLPAKKAKDATFKDEVDEQAALVHHKDKVREPGPLSLLDSYVLQKRARTEVSETILAKLVNSGMSSVSFRLISTHVVAAGYGVKCESTERLLLEDKVGGVRVCSSGLDELNGRYLAVDSDKSGEDAGNVDIQTISMVVRKAWANPDKESWHMRIGSTLMSRKILSSKVIHNPEIQQYLEAIFSFLMSATVAGREATSVVGSKFPLNQVKSHLPGSMKFYEVLEDVPDFAVVDNGTAVEVTHGRFKVLEAVLVDYLENEALRGRMNVSLKLICKELLGGESSSTEKTNGLDTPDLTYADLLKFINARKPLFTVDGGSLASVLVGLGETDYLEKWKRRNAHALALLPHPDKRAWRSRKEDTKEMCPKCMAKHFIPVYRPIVAKPGSRGRKRKDLVPLVDYWVPQEATDMLDVQICEMGRWNGFEPYV